MYFAHGNVRWPNSAEEYIALKNNHVGEPIIYSTVLPVLNAESIDAEISCYEIYMELCMTDGTHIILIF